MKHQKALFAFLVLSLLPLAGSPKVQAQSGLVISEFMANNVATIKDDFGQFPDWIEIYNGSAATVNLEGYYLTDNLGLPTQWRFPATNIFVGQHLLVWASGRDRKVPGLPLHTNFKLSNNGEQVGLVKPDGTTVVHSYTFGLQLPDRSFGLGVNVLSSTNFLPLGAAARYYVPTNNALSNKWWQIGFDDSAWIAAQTGIGFDRAANSLLTPFIKSDSGLAMTNSTTKRTSLFIRVPFNISDLGQVPNVNMDIRWDDGFIAYINGVEFSRKGFSAATSPSSSSAANLNRTNDQVVIPDSLFSGLISQNLRVGPNVLAIQGMNNTGANADFLIAPELVSRAIEYNLSDERYFANPTPSSANASGFAGQADEVVFSTNSTTFLNNFELTLNVPTASPLGEIRYTIDGKAPATNSPLYASPLKITNSVPIRARAFEPGFLPGPVHSETYIKLGPTMVNASSDVPLILVHSFGGGGFSQDTLKSAVIFIHNPVHGRASFTNAPDQVIRAGLKIRGSSTAGNAKYNWAVHCWDEDNAPTNIPILGMPADNEWVFHAPFGFDPSLFHNPLASDMSNEIGRYASRYRFAEVYLNENLATSTNATVSTKNYFGVYNIIERITVDPQRVNIAKLTDADVNPPEVTGGYLMSIDRPVASDPPFSAGGQSINYLEPKYAEITLPQRDPQEQYLTKYLNSFGAALSSKSWTNPVTGYLPFIDRGAWIDHIIINVISFNVDALRLSAYFYKDRNGPIVFGPIWDFDRAFGSTDGRDANPLVWSDGGGTDFFNYPWWDRMFADPAFFQAFIDRYQELREGLYSTPNFFALMDRLNSEVSESAVRDLALWQNGKRGGTQATELAFFKNWIKSRFLFMDTNFLAKPRLSQLGGTVAPGTQITLTAPAKSTIYYTLDGSDPRLAYGAINPAALLYTAPITVNGEARVVVRGWDATHKNLTGGGNPPISSPWSGPRIARYILDASAVKGDLIVTEINYNPGKPTASELAQAPAATRESFEFIEIKNVSNHRVDLLGARFTQGVQFTFETNSTYAVEAGGFLLLVKDPVAFAARYGNGPSVSGVYAGSLNDSGDTLRLEDAANNELFKLTYNNAWHPATDGLGFTLNRRDLSLSDSSRYGWGPSSAPGGSPGAENPAAAPLPNILVNEVLASSSGKELDTIELLNHSAGLADIGGWFLTDDRSQPRKYVIAKGTKIQAGGFLTFTEKDFNDAALGTNAFQLSSKGDEAWIFAADAAGNLLGYSHGFSFGPSDVNTSFGRYLLSTGKEVFPAQRALTLGAPNVGPRVGPVVIREIHYHPPDFPLNGQFWDNTDDEFIELQNITALPLSLYDSTLSAAWHVRGDADFEFPEGFTLAANEVIVLVSFNPETKPDQASAFRARFNVPAATRLAGPLKGHLGNGSGVVRLNSPGPVDSDTGDIFYVTADEVEYQDGSPWPAGADGAGASLQKKDRALFGNDPASWIAALPTAGGSFAIGQAPTITQQPVGSTVVGGTSASLSVKADGPTPFSYLWKVDGQTVPGATSATLTLNPVHVSDGGSYSVVIVNAFGSAESASALLNVLQPASITAQPEGKSVKPGTSFTLSVDAIGTGKITYQWFFNGKPIVGATSSSLTVNNAKLEDTGSYTAKATDTIGSDTSVAALVTVLVPPTVTLQPQSTIALVGDTVQFEVQAFGLQPITYQWRRTAPGASSAADVKGATNRVFRIPNVQTATAGVYAVTMKSPATVNTTSPKSANAVLIVMDDADKDGMGDQWEIQNGLNPADPSDAARDDDADGYTNLQEFLAGTNPKDKQSFLKIDSVAIGTNGIQMGFIARTNRSYTLQFKEAVDHGKWQIAAQVTGGRTNEASAIVVDPLPSSKQRLYRLVAPEQFDNTGLSGPTILSSPISQRVDVGDTVVLEVQASGTGVLNYQWSKGRAVLPSQTGPTLTLANVALEDTEAYSALVSDDIGSASSDPAVLTVLEKPLITQQPASQTLNAGQTLTLEVHATGSGALSYIWLFNNSVIAGKTDPKLVIPGVTSQNVGSYRVAVKMATANGPQTVSSDTALVRVNE